jgi:hypothetical protein
MHHKSSCLDFQKGFANKNNKSLQYIHQRELHYLFHTRLRLQQHLNHCSNKIQCLRKKLNRYRRRRQEEEVEEEVEEVEEEEEEEVEQREKIDAKHH